MGGGLMAPQNAFDHHAQMHKRRKPNPCEFQYQPMWHQKKVIFGSLGYPVLPRQQVCQGVPKTPKPPFHNEIQKFSKAKSESTPEKAPKIPPNTKFQ